MAQTPRIIGHVEVVLYAGLRDADPIEVGTVSVPLTLSTLRAKTVEAQLGEALDYVGESVAAIFREGNA